MAFVTTQGTKFMLGGVEWIPFGGATYGYYGSNAAYANRVDAAKAAGFNILRHVNYLQIVPWVNPPYSADAGFEYDEAKWARMDYGLDYARQKGIKILLDLSDIQGVSDVREYTWNSTEHRTLFQDFVEWLAERENTYNGRLYKNDDTIGLFAISGEVGNQAAGSSYNFFNSVGGWMKTAGFQQLIHAGGMKPEQIVDASYEFGNYNPIDILSSDNIDCASTHPYYTQQNMIDLFPDINSYAIAKNKPWFIEEFGYAVADATKANNFQFIYDTGRGEGAAGFLFWGFDNNGSDGYGYTGYHVSPNTPLTYNLVRHYAREFSKRRNGAFPTFFK